MTCIITRLNSVQYSRIISWIIIKYLYGVVFLQTLMMIINYQFDGIRDSNREVIKQHESVQLTVNDWWNVTI